MNFENDHPCGAFGFAEARGQSGPEALEEIVLKKFKVVNELLEQAEVDPPVVAEEETWAQGWPGGCTI